MSRAVVIDPNAAGRLILTEVPEPWLNLRDAIACVAAISLDRGEERRAKGAEAGGGRAGTWSARSSRPQAMARGR